MQQHSRGLNRHLISSRLVWTKAVVISVARVQHDGNVTDICCYSEIFFFLSIALSWRVTLYSRPTEVCSVNRPPPPGCVSKKKRRHSNNCNQRDERKPGRVIQAAEIKFDSPIFNRPTGVYVHTRIRNIG